MSDLSSFFEATGKYTARLIEVATEDGDRPVDQCVMDLIFAAASLMVAVHVGSGGTGDLCPPMTKNPAYNVAAQGVADLAATFMGKETESPS